MELLQRAVVAYADVGNAQLLQILVEQSLILLVEGACGFVEESQKGSVQEDPCKRNALLFPHREDIRPIHDAAEVAPNALDQLAEIHFLKSLPDQLIVRPLVVLWIDHLFPQITLHHVGALGEKHQVVELRTIHTAATALPKSRNGSQ